MAKTTSEVRTMLVEAMERCANGELTPEDGRSMVGLANQITHNMAVEVKVMAMKRKMDGVSEAFGSLRIDK